MPNAVSPGTVLSSNEPTARDHCDPRPEELLFGRVAFGIRYQWFRNWVNGTAGQRLGLAPIPGTPVNLRALRHGFAVHTQARWYRAGEDVGALVPRLSTYLGHRDVCSTFWYLSAAPELLTLAAGRLEADPGGRP